MHNACNWRSKTRKLSKFAYYSSPREWRWGAPAFPAPWLRLCYVPRPKIRSASPNYCDCTTTGVIYRVGRVVGVPPLFEVGVRCSCIKTIGVTMTNHLSANVHVRNVFRNSAQWLLALKLLRCDGTAWLTTPWHTSTRPSSSPSCCMFHRHDMVLPGAPNLQVMEHSVNCMTWNLQVVEFGSKRFHVCP